MNNFVKTKDIMMKDKELIKYYEQLLLKTDGFGNSKKKEVVKSLQNLYTQHDSPIVFAKQALKLFP
jgi:hypothetical protein